MTMATLELEFHRESVEAVRTCKTLGYVPTYWIRLMSENGAAGAAKHLLAPGDQWQDGLTTLYELGRPDLSVEHAVLAPKYQTLFTEEERNIARSRLVRVDVRH